MAKLKRFGKSIFRKNKSAQGATQIDLADTLEEAALLVQRNAYAETLQLLRPLLATHGRSADLHHFLGTAELGVGHALQALTYFEQAQQLDRNPARWMPLIRLYVQSGYPHLALQAYHQARNATKGATPTEEWRTILAEAEANTAHEAQTAGVSVEKMQTAFVALEQGQLALARGEFAAAVAANQRAVRALPGALPSRNNLALAYFFDGQPQKAIAGAKQVLAEDANNIQALGNLIRFLVWTGRGAEAADYWATLAQQEPDDDVGYVKMIEAAGVMQDDEAVMAQFRRLRRSDLFDPKNVSSAAQMVQRFVAIAQANLGERKDALRRFQQLDAQFPHIAHYTAALKAGKPGLGWADRYPYYSVYELLPTSAMQEFAQLIDAQATVPPKRWQKRQTVFLEKYPQIVVVGEKLIWEEQKPDLGGQILLTVGTADAYAALRRFGLSQAGPDEERLGVLQQLLEAGAITEQETLRVWHRGAWTEIQLRSYELTEEADVEYAPAVADAINRGTAAMQQGDDKRAEKFFRQAVELDPKAKEAHNNLGAIYSHRGDVDAAKAALQKAVELDPDYVFPRLNLALYALREEDGLAEAKAWLDPVPHIKRMQPKEMAFYAYLQARVAVEEEDLARANQSITSALAIMPDFEPAVEYQKYIKRLESAQSLQSGWARFQAEQQAREQQKRTRLQTKLTTTTPKLKSALTLYSKDVLLSIANVTLYGGGYSQLRKAELLDYLITNLTQPDTIERVIGNLSAQERAALQQVIAADYTVSWQEFSQQYDNDMEESPYWQYHEPTNIMGRLRRYALLVEATVNGQLLLVVPLELRPLIRHALADTK